MGTASPWISERASQMLYFFSSGGNWFLCECLYSRLPHVNRVFWNLLCGRLDKNRKWWAPTLEWTCLGDKRFFFERSQNKQKSDHRYRFKRSMLVSIDSRMWPFIKGLAHSRSPDQSSLESELRATSHILWRSQTSKYYNLHVFIFYGIAKEYIDCLQVVLAQQPNWQLFIIFLKTSDGQV